MGFNFFKKAKAVSAFLLLNIFSLAFAKEIEIPSTVPMFTIMTDPYTEYKKEQLSGYEIIIYSMMFGLVDSTASEEWTDTIKQFHSMAAKLEKYKNLSELDLSEKIMEVMYSDVLVKYSRYQTKVDEMVKTGNYNCVSASILFLALAKQCGLDAHMQETPVHSFVTVYTKDGKSFDVETTNPYGVNPGVKKTKEVKPNGNIKYTVVPQNYYAKRMEISDRKAVTLVAKNLCADLSDKNDYTTGVPLIITAYSFVNKEKSFVKQDLDKMCANFTAYANDNYEFSKALEFLTIIIDGYGSSPLLQEHYDDVAYNEAANFCNNNEFESAWKTYYTRDKLSAKTSEEIYEMIMESETLNSVNELMKTKDYLGAASLCRERLEKIPSSELLKKSLSNCLYNHGVTVHNQVVPLMNNGEYKEALKILEEALKDNPSNQMIKEDIKKIRARM